MLKAQGTTNQSYFLQNNSMFALEINDVSSDGFPQSESRASQSNGKGKHPPLVLLDRVTPILGQFGMHGE